MFKDRKEAGARLAERLTSYRGCKEAMVLGLARGGVVVAYEIAQALSLPLNVLVARKLGAPSTPELAIGAVTEEGETLLNPPIIAFVGASHTYIQSEVERQQKLAKERAALYRRVSPLGELKGKIVILVDDGIATGATMLVEIQSLRKRGVSKIIAASPVAAGQAWRAIQALVDEAICLDLQESFLGISTFYDNFAQVEDETIISLLKNA